MLGVRNPLLHLAIRNESAVQDVFLVDALGPLTFEIEGIAGGQNARTRLDFGGRSAINLVENACLVINVVGGVIAFYLVTVKKMLETNVSARYSISRVTVVIDFVGVQ
jgi:hypothetical protein